MPSRRYYDSYSDDDSGDDDDDKPKKIALTEAEIAIERERAKKERERNIESEREKLKKRDSKRDEDSENALNTQANKLISQQEEIEKYIRDHILEINQKIYDERQKYMNNKKDREQRVSDAVTAEPKEIRKQSNILDDSKKKEKKTVRFKPRYETPQDIYIHRQDHPQRTKEKKIIPYRGEAVITNPGEAVITNPGTRWRGGKKNRKTKKSRNYKKNRKTKKSRNYKKKQKDKEIKKL